MTTLVTGGEVNTGSLGKMRVEWIKGVCEAVVVNFEGSEI